MENLSDNDIILNLVEFKNLIKQQREYCYEMQEESKIKDEEIRILKLKNQKYKLYYKQNNTNKNNNNKDLFYYKKKIESKNKEQDLKIKEIENLKKELQIKNNIIKEIEDKNKIIKQKDLEIEEKNKIIKQKDLEIEEKNKIIKQKDLEIEDYKKQIDNKIYKIEIKKKAYKKELNNLRNENMNIKNNMDIFKNMFLLGNQGINSRMHEIKEEQPKLLYSNVDVTHNNNLFINSISQKKELNIETSSRKIPLTKIDDTILNHQLKMGSVLGELKSKIGPKYFE